MTKQKDPAWANNGQFLSFVEEFLRDKDSISADAYDRLCSEVDRRWKGILTNPDAVEGKKGKPKFKDRQKNLVGRIRDLGSKA